MNNLHFELYNMHSEVNKQHFELYNLRLELCTFNKILLCC